jgi:hypothetical protein
MEKNFDIDQNTFGSRRIQINDAKRKFNKLKREYESRENDNGEEFVSIGTKRLEIDDEGDEDQSNNKSKSVRHKYSF